MRVFTRLLAERNVDPARWAGRRFVFVAYDQLSDAIGPLARAPADTLGIVLVENPWKAARRPYHRQKLALVLANLRHFALEQAARGVAVAHLVHDGPYRDALEPFARRHGRLVMMEAAEREMRADLAPLVATGLMEVLPHEGWLTTEAQFAASQAQGPPWRMDAFYRHVRRELGVLMEPAGAGGGKPRGGRWSFDADNRKPWRGAPPAPTPPRFAPDAVTREVGGLIEARFARHPGRLDLEALPATRADAHRMARWAIDHCLAHFGPYEDAMSAASSGLFHTRLSPLVNLHRVLPRDLLRAALQRAGDTPLASIEGYVRQKLGWREYMHHVHVLTDGFRSVPAGWPQPPVAPVPGDGGYAAWAGRAWQRGTDAGDVDGGARPSHLGGTTPLPPAWWGRPSGLACLDQVVADVWREAWSHHITRLMVLSNLATLLDVDARQLTDWFWVAYQDAYDWVVEPNVLGMGAHAMGDLFMTKPYVASAAYIDRMSDFCGRCRFDPKRDCPVTPLYWAFLDRQRERLQGNPRLRGPLQAAAARSDDQRAADRRVFRLAVDTLGRGEALTPAAVAAAVAAPHTP